MLNYALFIAVREMVDYVQALIALAKAVEAHTLPRFPAREETLTLDVQQSKGELDEIARLGRVPSLYTVTPLYYEPDIDLLATSVYPDKPADEARRIVITNSTLREYYRSLKVMAENLWRHILSRLRDYDDVHIESVRAFFALGLSSETRIAGSDATRMGWLMSLSNA